MYHSPAFRIKLVLLALAGLNALIFHRTIYRDVAHWDPARWRRFARGWPACCRWCSGSRSSRRGAPSLTRPDTTSDDGIALAGVRVDAAHLPLGETIRHSAALIARLRSFT